MKLKTSEPQQFYMKWNMKHEINMKVASLDDDMFEGLVCYLPTWACVDQKHNDQNQDQIIGTGARFYYRDQKLLG